MRVLFVIRSLHMGGAERQCSSLAVNLRRRGHEVRVVSLAPGGVLAAELLRNDVELRSCGHRGPRDLLRSGMRLRSEVADFVPDVVYSFMSVSNVLCALFLRGKQRQRLVWGVRASWVDHPGYGTLTRVVLRLEGWLARRPRLIISNSFAGADYHVKLGYPRERTQVVENAIDSDVFDYSQVSREEVRHRLGIPEDRRIVVMVARIDPIKRHDTFLSAAAQVAAQRSDVDFWCIGGGGESLTRELQSRTQELGLSSRITWHGEVRDTPALVALLSAADLAVSASMAEGFPNSVAECMACGLRVVGTDAGDTRRIIGHSGECTAIGDVAAMSAAILRQLNAIASREVVRADYLSRFAPPLLLERHESLLTSVAENSAR